MAAWSSNEYRDRIRQTSADASRVYRSLVSQPSWVVKTAVMLAAVAVIGMVLLLIIPAIVVFVLVMIAGALVERLRRMIVPLLPVRDSQGRRNVRVLTRRDP